jgi:hypothetical protein
LIAWIPLLFGGWFGSCVENQPPKAAQSEPGYLSRKADAAWNRIALALMAQVQSERAELQSRLLAEVARLPQGSVDAPENHDEEMKTSGTYGQLPEVRVDIEPGAIFPMPLGQPHRFSWYQVSLRARELGLALDRFAQGFEKWRTLPPRERVARYPEVAGAWDDIDSRTALLAHHVRYLSTWVPQLSRQWAESRRGSRPVQYQLTAAIQQGDPRLMDTLREVLRPSRVLKRPFLPDDIKDAVVTIPIATDVTSRRFLAEVEGALATYWNQSSWARDQGTRFVIRWMAVPRDEAFARGRISLDEHLARFPRDRAALTTGGLTTYVRGQALVLGPGKIQPRTLAHELGHLMGFGDCYLRTLSAQGPLGILGTAVLEWDNPLYPDDIMCDNTVGAARAEAW